MVRNDPASTQASDEACVDAALAGNREAFGVLFDRHSPRVLSHCYRLIGDRPTSEDLTSVVFLEAWRRRGSMRFVDGSSLPWLLVTATNVAQNHRRALRRYRAAIDRLPIGSSESDDPAESAAARVDAARSAGSIRSALSGLRKTDQQVVSLCLVAGLSYEETADVLGISVGAVRNRLSRSRKKLRESIELGWIQHEEVEQCRTS